MIAALALFVGHQACNAVAGATTIAEVLAFRFHPVSICCARSKKGLAPTLKMRWKTMANRAEVWQFKYLFA